MPAPITLASLRSVPLAYATCSIGSSPSDTLPDKLLAISNAGFTAIELSFPDIQQHAEKLHNREVASDSYAELTLAARDIAKLCKKLNLEIMMLQPFSNFEGWPRGSVEREQVFLKAKAWMQLMEACGTDLLQVGSTDSLEESISTNRADIVRDLRELADMLAKQNMRMAYENWCWSTHARTWKDVWEIVKEVDRPNVGLCLDTFQTAGSEWADPRSPSGLLEGIPKPELERRWKENMLKLSQTIPGTKIFLLQVSDAYKPAKAIENEAKDGLRPRAQWSHAYRPMPYAGGYLPIEDVTKAVLKTGFRGYFSMEIFDSGPEGKGKEHEVNQYAKKAMESMQRLFKNVAETNE
ncbi:putative 3-dehydroshikimate dehydratase [Talaromyces proteolyticus]|uniref:3-dehydroshikimate dehydratase n=1 Tax=Talaromyces proteolyticus TaxID=1131652 RepID=A0AAD4KDV1_9EURO|nr:putative 3-dehydroshikimate dehydratase [Talaromyces proteolyticus]KAH8689482.1 putative 3-dehydroshikimate dehydratase [Talaromyces proteolyticus]